MVAIVVLDYLLSYGYFMVTIYGKVMLCLLYIHLHPKPAYLPPLLPSNLLLSTHGQEQEK